MHGLIFETSIWLLAGSTRLLPSAPVWSPVRNSRRLLCCVVNDKFINGSAWEKSHAHSSAEYVDPKVTHALSYLSLHVNIQQSAVAFKTEIQNWTTDFGQATDCMQYISGQAEAATDTSYTHCDKHHCNQFHSDIGATILVCRPRT